jgi:hypothetical protein
MDGRGNGGGGGGGGGGGWTTTRGALNLERTTGAKRSSQVGARAAGPGRSVVGGGDGGGGGGGGGGLECAREVERARNRSTPSGSRRVRVGA